MRNTDLADDGFRRNNWSGSGRFCLPLYSEKLKLENQARFESSRMWDRTFAYENRKNGEPVIKIDAYEYVNIRYTPFYRP